MQKFLSKHVRDIQGNILATIVAIGPNKIGVAVCSSKDMPSKKAGTHLAIARAFMGEVEKIPNKSVTYLYYGTILVYTSLREILEHELNMMENRAQKYFKSTNVALKE